MQFGLVLQPNPPSSRVVELASRAEEYGFTHLWLYDSPVLWLEPFVVLSRVLAETSRIIVGPMVTNPGTRDWSVLASTFATLNEIHGPRTICGMGRGDSALRYIGRRPAGLEEMVQAMRVVKNLVAGRSTELNGVQINFPWLEKGWDLPIWVAGYGPRALDRIGRSADGFILQLADPQILEWTLQGVEQGALQVGRRPSAITTCVAAPAYVGSDIEHQRAQLRWFGGMVGNHVADIVRRYGQSQTDIPRALTDYIEGRGGYDYSHHGRAGNPSTEFVPDEIVERFCVMGEASDHVEKLRTLERHGADQFAIYLMHDAEDATLDAYGREVIPAFAGQRQPGEQLQ